MLAEASLKWATPDGDKMIAEMARVSNPDNKDNHETAPRLINYLMRHRHWSPFEMATMCVEIATTRDIGRQILRHRSFSFQEFSGRYAAYDDLRTDRDVRGQDPMNRQNSVDYDPEDSDDAEIIDAWQSEVYRIAKSAKTAYDCQLANGVAKECARALLPEGMVPTTMYMTGTIRSWIHYISERTADGVQREHRVLAEKIKEIFKAEFPMVYAASQMKTAEQERIDELEDAMLLCVSQFEFYAKSHREKGTEDGDKKAEVNAEFSARLMKLYERKWR